VFGWIAGLGAQHRCRRDVHQATAVVEPVEAANQGDWTAVVLDDARDGRVDAGGARDVAMRCLSSISGGAVRRPGSADRWNAPSSSRNRSAPILLKSSTARRIVEVIQRTLCNRCAGSPLLLPALGVIAKNDAAAPAVRFGIRDRGVENRPFARHTPKLGAGHQRQARFQSEGSAVSSHCARYSKLALWRVPSEAGRIALYVRQHAQRVREAEREQAHRVDAHRHARITLFDTLIRRLGDADALGHHDYGQSPTAARVANVAAELGQRSVQRGRQNVGGFGSHVYWNM
jgi:hypothetical protein